MIGDSFLWELKQKHFAEYPAAASKPRSSCMAVLSPTRAEPSRGRAEGPRTGEASRRAWKMAGPSLRQAARSNARISLLLLSHLGCLFLLVSEGSAESSRLGRRAVGVRCDS